MPTITTEISFEVIGPAAIVGVDNGDLDSPEPFKSNQRETRDGHCLMIVQSSREAGKIKVVAKAKGLPDATIELESQPSTRTPALQ